MTTITGFSTPEEAKQFVLQRVYEEAVAAGVSFTAFEKRLLADTASNPAATEEEIEFFDVEHGEEFWAKVAALVNEGLLRERRERGWAAWRAYRRALKLAAKSGDYFAGILIVSDFAPLSSQSGWRGHAWSIVAGIILGLAVVAAILISAIYGR